jgi:hypothetical protein
LCEKSSGIEGFFVPSKQAKLFRRISDTGVNFASIYSVPESNSQFPEDLVFLKTIKGHTCSFVKGALP